MIEHKLDDLQKSVNEVKGDVKTLTEQAPMWRIVQLEKWRSGINTWLSGATLAILGAWAAVLFR